jgi:hypothetical protein
MVSAFDEFSIDTTNQQIRQDFVDSLCTPLWMRVRFPPSPQNIHQAPSGAFCFVEIERANCFARVGNRKTQAYREAMPSRGQECLVFLEQRE